MTLYQLIIVLVTGVAAGFLNVVAGGGSLLTLPALIFIGLPPSVANGTNRVAILVQNIVAGTKFRQEGFRDIQLGMSLSFPAVLGAVLGSELAIAVPEQWFKRVLAVVMVLALIGVFSKKKKARPASNADPGAAATAPSRPGTQPERREKLRHSKAQYALFFLIGVYGGFIQAGVGYFLIFALAGIGGLSLVRTNSLKVIVIGIYLVPSIAVFFSNAKISWLPAAVLAIGTGVGGWLGSSFSIKGGDRWIRWVVTVVILVMAAKLMGLFGT